MQTTLSEKDEAIIAQLPETADRAALIHGAYSIWQARREVEAAPIAEDFKVTRKRALQRVRKLAERLEQLSGNEIRSYEIRKYGDVASRVLPKRWHVPPEGHYDLRQTAREFLAWVDGEEPGGC